MTSEALPDYHRFEFTAPVDKRYGISHNVYHKGEGSPVVIIQELPGIGPETLQLADSLVESGHSVYLPHLFGPLGEVNLAGNLARVFCMQKEFALFSANKTSPITIWLKALCAKVRSDLSAKGVGVIGMCLTGNFAISLIADDNVLAAVAAQPSMPLHKQSGLHMSAEDVESIKLALDEKGPMLAYRFEKDRLCTRKKFTALDETFNRNDAGKKCKRIKCGEMPGSGHSVFTLDFVDKKGHPTYKALQEVKNYFNQALN